MQQIIFVNRLSTLLFLFPATLLFCKAFLLFFLATLFFSKTFLLFFLATLFLSKTFLLFLLATPFFSKSFLLLLLATLLLCKAFLFLLFATLLFSKSFLLYLLATLLLCKAFLFLLRFFAPQFFGDTFHLFPLLIGKFFLFLFLNFGFVHFSLLNRMRFFLRCCIAFVFRVKKEIYILLKSLIYTVFLLFRRIQRGDSRFQRCINLPQFLQHDIPFNIGQRETILACKFKFFKNFGQLFKSILHFVEINGLTETKYC